MDERRIRLYGWVCVGCDLLAVVLGSEGLEGGFDDAAAETEDEVEG